MCNFINKTLHAQNGGASVIIIVNFGNKMLRDSELITVGCPREYLDLCENVSIPVAMMSFRDALQLAKYARDDVRCVRPTHKSETDAGSFGYLRV